MVTPCGNGPAVMGTLAAPKSPQENMEIYRLVASFSQDNQMEREVWLGWNSMNPFMWENGAPAYPHGFSAFDSGGQAGANGWPVNTRNPFGMPPGFAPVMRRELGTIPGRQGPNRRMIPASQGPVWQVAELTGPTHAFVCEVPAGQTIVGQQQPTNPNFPNQPNQPFGPNQPNNPNQPFGPNQPNNPNQPNQPFAPNQPTTPNRPNQPFTPNQPNNPNQPNTPNTPNRPNQPNQPRLFQ
ncbi:41 kDa spicule matrix protein [Strongylocentrotus purpuratus]|nr:41 kDa spicule matrix protein [Strongylocentrotus purpuratus]|eukprot:XP_011662185.1 PREDICTED: 41 kDa spicule matrix protein-like [Strongylocentrotus purpuratus]